jgi:hypothetical protein
MPNYCVKELGYSLILCLGSLTFGIVLGFPSAAIPEMQADWGKDVVTETSCNVVNSIFEKFIVGSPSNPGHIS